jgi:hypothetical protein
MIAVAIVAKIVVAHSEHFSCDTMSMIKRSGLAFPALERSWGLARIRPE